MACLVCLPAVEEIFLFDLAEAGFILDSHQLEDANSYTPEPKHGQHDEEGLVVHVKQLVQLLCAVSQRKYDHNGTGPNPEPKDWLLQNTQTCKRISALFGSQAAASP